VPISTFRNFDLRILAWPVFSPIWFSKNSGISRKKTPPKDFGRQNNLPADPEKRPFGLYFLCHTTLFRPTPLSPSPRSCFRMFPGFLRVCPFLLFSFVIKTRLHTIFYIQYFTFHLYFHLLLTIFTYVFTFILTFHHYFRYSFNFYLQHQLTLRLLANPLITL